MSIKRKPEKLTPSQFYKKIRPEYFSDSELTYQTVLPREQLAFELNQISTNQKQDDFETFARRLAEKFISPNLIPQVGPTGGGDGKTDSETYEVSEYISDRWFVPENGWDNNEKWAFAISAKEDWRGKVRTDVKKIVGTERGYSKVFFITNQKPSSKKKKEVEDKLEEEFNINVTILDSEWILEKVYNNDLIELAVDSLNLSRTFKDKRMILGANDANRKKRLDELEKKISDPNRYFDYDFQLVEDALEAAIVSRMLERPREEIEGKFARATRFCKKLNHKKQWQRIHYQKAWTYLHWYDDYEGFLEEYHELKKYIDTNSNFAEIELYNNLFNSLRGIEASGILKENKIEVNIEAEIEEFRGFLLKIKEEKTKATTSIVASFMYLIQEILDSIKQENDPNSEFHEISKIFKKSQNHLDFPFESFKTMIQNLGKLFPDNEAYDNLIDNIAEISEKRNSQISAGEIFINLGAQKLVAKNYPKSVVYFGKAILKLAKEEEKDNMFSALLGLAHSYRSIGLIWASNNCLISACAIAIRAWQEKGIITELFYKCLLELTQNELFKGRIPILFLWYELLEITSKQINIDDKEIEFELSQIDACLSVRLIHSEDDEIQLLEKLPGLLKDFQLWLSEDTCYYLLGYFNLISEEYKSVNINNEKDLDEYYEKVSNQPFTEQMLSKNNFLDKEKLCLDSKILGCVFSIEFNKNTELLLCAETILAFLEAFFATSLEKVVPNTEEIKLVLRFNKEIELLEINETETSNKFILETNIFDFQNDSAHDHIFQVLLKLISYIIANNFRMGDSKNYLQALFEKEEVIERISLILEHRNFTKNILGENPKFFIDDWISKTNIKSFQNKRDTKIPFNTGVEVYKKKKNKHFNPKKDFKNAFHNNRKVYSLIDDNLWNKAKWEGFGSNLHEKGLGIFIAFKNEDFGKKIFKQWIEKFGRIDQQEQIKITIIKGVDKKNPFWYRIAISNNIKKTDLQEGNIFTFSIRFHELNADSPENLNNLIRSFEKTKKYHLCPAKIVDKQTGSILPYYDLAIFKSEIYIKEAWEISDSDLDSGAIRPNDDPIIPENVENPPILKVLRRKQK